MLAEEGLATENTEEHGSHFLLLFRVLPCPSVANLLKIRRLRGKVMLAEEDLTFKIRGCVFEVFRELGAGYLEKVYQNALLIELHHAGLRAASQVPLVVHYKGQEVGHYIADIVVENKILLELKAIAALTREHEAQILNYLKATGLKVGLLINFSAPKAQVKRFVL